MQDDDNLYAVTTSLS